MIEPRSFPASVRSQGSVGRKVGIGRRATPLIVRGNLNKLVPSGTISVAG